MIKNTYRFWSYTLIIFDILLLSLAAIISLSLIFSTIKLGISPMPSSKKATKAMLILIEETGTGPIIDLGSGWGNFVITLAKNKPQRQVIGYELSFLPWLTSILLKKLLGLKNLTLHRQNFYSVNLPEASVLVCYLYPEAMCKIQQNLLLKPNVDFLISNNFALPSQQADKIIPLDDFYKSPVLLYKIDHSGCVPLTEDQD